MTSQSINYATYTKVDYNIKNNADIFYDQFDLSDYFIKSSDDNPLFQYSKFCYDYRPEKQEIIDIYTNLQNMNFKFFDTLYKRFVFSGLFAEGGLCQSGSYCQSVKVQAKLKGSKSQGTTWKRFASFVTRTVGFGEISDDKTANIYYCGGEKPLPPVEYVNTGTFELKKIGTFNSYIQEKVEKSDNPTNDCMHIFTDDIEELNACKAEQPGQKTIDELITPSKNVKDIAEKFDLSYDGLQYIFSPFVTASASQEYSTKIPKLIGPGSNGNICLMHHISWEMTSDEIKKQYCYPVQQILLDRDSYKTINEYFIDFAKKYICWYQSQFIPLYQLQIIIPLIIFYNPPPFLHMYTSANTKNC